MTGDDTPRERLARVENEVSHIKENLEAANKKLDTLHDLMMQAQGGAKMLNLMRYTVAGIAGAAATYLPHISKFMSGLPK
jgi:hypothetical protein